MVDSKFYIKHYLKKPVVVKEITSSISKLRSIITLVGGTAFSRITTKARRRHHIKTIGIFTVYDLRTILKVFTTQYPEKGLLANVFDEDIRRKIFVELHDLVYAF